MPSGTYIRSEKTREKLSNGLKEFHRKKGISEEKEQQTPEGRDKCDFSNSQIDNMNREQLLDALTQCGEDILKRVEILSGHWRCLISMQEKRRKLEERLVELGGSIGRLDSKAKDWKEE